jgi:hypothetical protein
VTIAGRDLLPHVLFQGAVATISAYSPTSVTATVPPGATTGPIGMHDRTFTHVFTVTRSRATDTPATSAESSGARPGVDRGPGSVTLPGRTLPTAPGANGCCTVVANPALAGRLGRLVVAFPADAVPTGTRVVVLKDGNEVQAGYGSQSWDLLAGTYDVSVSGKVILNVTVQARSDTNVRVGVLRVSAGEQTRAEVLDGDTAISGGYGDQLVGLPAGSYGLLIAGQTETFTIEEGGVTDF